ncbi:MAG: PAS domain S-box protein [Thermoanaerobaculia bacterium]
MSTADRRTARVIRRFLLLWLPAAVVVAAAAALLHSERRTATVSEFRARQEVSLAAVHDEIASEFSGVEADLRFVASLSSLKDLIRDGAPANRARFAADLVEMCRHTNSYDGAGVLDERGRQLVRVDVSPDGPHILPESRLGDHSQSLWTVESFRLAPSATYVSRFEPASDGGSPKIPLKPIVRFTTPVADRAGVVRGLVVLDLLGARVLDQVRSGVGAPTPLVLLDSEGFWLVGPTPESEWGFAVPERKERAFSREFPAVWAQVASADIGAFEAPLGLVTFRTIHAPAGAVAPTLKLVSVVPRSALYVPLSAAIRWIALGAAGILAILGIAAWQQASASESVRQAAIAALERERRYRLLFERNLAGVYRSTLDGRLLDCNDSFVKILGFESREELISRRTTSLYFDAKERSRLIDRLLAEGFVQNQEMRLIRKDGSEVWVLMSVGLVGEAPGQPGFLEGTLVDISERKRAEKAILEQKTTLETVLANMAQAMLIVDADLRVVAFNGKFEPLFGFSQGEMRSGESLETLVRLWAARTHTDDARLESVLAAVRRREPFVSEYPQRILDGPTTWIQLFHNPLPAGGFVRTYTDVTERRRAEEALRVSERFTRSIVENMLGGLIITDSMGAIESANPAAERIFGWTREELVGRPLATLMPPDAAEGTEKFLRSAYRKAIGQISEWVGRRKNGQLFPFELSLFEFETPEGKHFGGNVHDITERREVERLKMEFVSSVSHELRTPLTSIRGSLGLLSSGALGTLPPDAGDLVAVAERNVIRLIGLINDILDLERLKDGRIELHLTASPADSIVGRAVESVHAFASQQGIALVTRPSDLVVRVDADRLVQVLVNLVSNAVKFSPRGRDVTVSIAATGDLAEFRVADHGRGIPPALRAAIFERYRQVEAGDAREKGGTGLGLAICKAIVEQHGGSIGVESEEGVGSTFWFRVPLALSPRISSSGPSSHVPRLALLVDDDVELLTVFARQLAEKGIGVRTATSVDEALKALREVKPDILILDLGLPDGDGQKVVEELRRDPRLTILPLLVYTGRDLTARDRESLTLGPTRHLTKSKASDEEVLRAVHELIRAGRSRRSSGTIRRIPGGPTS